MRGMPLAEAARALQDTAALWSIGAVTSSAVVGSACDALLTGCGTALTKTRVRAYGNRSAAGLGIR
jgi:hypothetical protein